MPQINNIISRLGNFYHNGGYMVNPYTCGYKKNVAQ